MKLIIPEKIIEGIKLHAINELPNECCGYLAGIENEIKEIYRMTNVDKSPEHFSFDPKEQFKIIKIMRENGWHPVVVYHSHPSTPARMSEEDIRLANDPDIFYGIISLQNNSFDFKIYSVIEKKVNNIDYEII